MITNGTDLEVHCGPDLETPLHVCCARGNAVITKALVDAKANCCATDAHGRSPLLVACMEDQPECAAVLLAAGAELEQPMAGGAAAPGPHGPHSATHRPRGHGAPLPTPAGNPGATPLYAAAFAGSYRCVALMCEAGARVNARTANGASPLLAAAQAPRRPRAPSTRPLTATHVHVHPHRSHASMAPVRPSAAGGAPGGDDAAFVVRRREGARLPRRHRHRSWQRGAISPCYRTAPHPPPGTARRLARAARVRPPECRLRSSEACRGLRSPPRAAATRRDGPLLLAAGIVVTPSEAEKLARDEGHAALLAWLEASRRFSTLHARPVDTSAAPFPSLPPRPPSTPSLLPLRMPRCPCALRAPARAPLTHCSQSPRLLPTRCSRWHGRHHVRVLTPQRAIELLRAGCSPHARSVPLGSTTPVGHAPRVHSAALARRPCRPARLGRLAQPSLPYTGCQDRSAEPSGGQGGGTGGGRRKGSLRER